MEEIGSFSEVDGIDETGRIAEIDSIDPLTSSSRWSSLWPVADQGHGGPVDPLTTSGLISGSTPLADELLLRVVIQNLVGISAAPLIARNQMKSRPPIVRSCSPSSRQPDPEFKFPQDAPSE